MIFHYKKNFFAGNNQLLRRCHFVPHSNKYTTTYLVTLLVSFLYSNGYFSRTSSLHYHFMVHSSSLWNFCGTFWTCFWLRILTAHSFSSSMWIFFHENMHTHLSTRKPTWFTKRIQCHCNSLFLGDWQRLMNFLHLCNFVRISLDCLVALIITISGVITLSLILILIFHIA